MTEPEWFLPLAEDGPVRAFAFPSAGGGCAQFTDLARMLDSHLALWAANLPGRQARLAEAPPDDLDQLVDRLAGELASLADRRYVLFGYCAGGLLAFLVARALREYAARPPAALVVVSAEAPDIAHRPHGLARLVSDQLWQRLVDDGGIDPDLAADQRLRRVAEPAVRADFLLLERYRYAPAPPLNCPIVVCHGTADRVRRGALLGWRRQTTQQLELYPLVGGHWALRDAPAGVADALTLAAKQTEPDEEDAGR